MFVYVNQSTLYVLMKTFMSVDNSKEIGYYSICTENPEALWFKFDLQILDYNPASEQDEIRIIYEEYLITYDNPDEVPLW